MVIAETYYRENANGSKDWFNPADVEAVDTTGAGDAFTGALACGWDRGPRDALTFACAAGALATTRPGASAASPTRAEIHALLTADA